MWRNMRERYEEVEKLFKQSKRHSELLNAMMNQNELFREILKDKEKRGKSGREQ